MSKRRDGWTGEWREGINENDGGKNDVHALGEFFGVKNWVGEIILFLFQKNNYYFSS